MNTFLIIHNEIFDLQLLESSVKCPYVVLNNIDNSFDYSLLTNISTLGLAWVNNNRYMSFFNYDNNYFPSSFENFINNIKNNYPLISTIDLITCNINTIEHINIINELSNKYNIIIRYSVNETNNQDWILESHNIDIKNIYFNDNINNWNYSLDLGYHTAIVMSNGTVRTFGHNNNGQLGNGTTSGGATSNPVSVSNITSGAIAVSIGGFHTAVLMSNGTVKTFGSNSQGQLGNGNNNSSSTPVDVLGISTAIAVSGGEAHTAVLLSNGTVKTFGSNFSGELGDQTTTSRNQPVDVYGITTAVAISGGSGFSAVVLSNGTVKTFGYNISGQLGNGNNNSSSTPVDVLGISTAIAVSCGYSHTAVLLSNGSVKTFGSNFQGQLGNGNYSYSNTPVDVIDINNCIQVSCGFYHTMFLLSNGKVKIVGRNYNGLLGIGNSDTSYRINIPITIPNINNAIAINCSAYSNTILLSDGTIRTFGWNLYGQLGDGTTTDRSTPITINTSSMTGLTVSNIIGYTQTVTIKGYIYNKKLSMLNDINLNNPFNITNNSSGNAFNLTNTSSGIGINITNTGSGNVLDISNNGSGFGLNINNSGTNITANIRKESGSSSNVLINTVSGSGNVLDISNNGTGITLNISNNGTGDCLRIADQASDTTLFRIDAAGRVGVGVSTSALTENVQFDASASSTRTLYNQNTTRIRNEFFDTGGRSALELNSTGCYIRGESDIRLEPSASTNSDYTTSFTRITSTGADNIIYQGYFGNAISDRKDYKIAFGTLASTETTLNIYTDISGRKVQLGNTQSSKSLPASSVGVLSILRSNTIHSTSPAISIEGDATTVAIDCNSIGRITEVLFPISANDVATKGYVDASYNATLLAANNTFTGTNTFNNNININGYVNSKAYMCSIYNNNNRNLGNENPVFWLKDITNSPAITDNGFPSSVINSTVGYFILPFVGRYIFFLNIRISDGTGTTNDIEIQPLYTNNRNTTITWSTLLGNQEIYFNAPVANRKTICYTLPLYITVDTGAVCFQQNFRDGGNMIIQNIYASMVYLGT